MTHDDLQLPDDIDSLKRLIFSQRETIARYQENIRWLEECNRLLKQKRFGVSSEKLSPQQRLLFNESEHAVDRVTDEVTPKPAADETVRVEAHDRAKRGRRPLPDYLPRNRVVIDFAEDQKVCEKDGTPLHVIREEVSEQLEYFPARIEVTQYVRPVYGCRKCEETIKTAPAPSHPIPKSIASPSLLAQIAIAKYADALPLHRQEVILKRIGVEISRGTLASWMIKVGDLFTPLVNLLRDKLLEAPLIHCDETPIQVLKEAGRPPTSQSYMWVQVRGGPGPRIVLFEYDPSRSSAVAERLLTGYQGYVQTDGYKGYSCLTQHEGLIGVGCWAHARRRFHDAVKGAGQGARTGIAKQGLDHIGRLYGVEREIAGMGTIDRLKVRQMKSRLIIDEMRTWLDHVQGTVPPKTLTGQALEYLAKEWSRLVVFLDDPVVPLDNNAAENAIRPFVVGRKNWIFSDTPSGAHASAAIYSIIETAKANNQEPFAYLHHVLSSIAAAKTVEDFEVLLPWRCRVDSLEH